MFYYLAWAIFRVLWYLRCVNIVFIGRENIPKSGPTIMAAKHWGWWDPCYIAMATKRRIRFLAGSKKPAYDFFWRLIATIPIRKGGYNRAALDEAIDVSKNGGFVGIFAIGHRQKNLIKPIAQKGCAFIAKKSEVNPPIIPVSIVSHTITGQTRRREIVVWAVAFGRPINPADFPDIDSLNGEISQSIIDLEKVTINLRGALLS